MNRTYQIKDSLVGWTSFGPGRWHEASAIPKDEVELFGIERWSGGQTSRPLLLPNSIKIFINRRADSVYNSGGLG